MLCKLLRWLPIHWIWIRVRAKIPKLPQFHLLNLGGRLLPFVRCAKLTMEVVPYVCSLWKRRADVLWLKIQAIYISTSPSFPCYSLFGAGWQKRCCELCSDSDCFDFQLKSAIILPVHFYVFRCALKSTRKICFQSYFMLMAREFKYTTWFHSL